jgi:hypothetical protein
LHWHRTGVTLPAGARNQPPDLRLPPASIRPRRWQRRAGGPQ